MKELDDKSVLVIIPRWIKQSRLSAALSQEQLGERLCVSKSNISAWENSRHEPSISQVLKIAAVCRVPFPEELGPAGANFPALPSDEEDLLLFYRKAGPELKVTMQRMVGSTTQQE